MIQRYPLTWPEGWKRTESYKRRSASFNRKEQVSDGAGGWQQKTKSLSIADAIARIFRELEALGVKHVHEDSVISTNLRLNLSGIPRGDQGEPGDPGAAVYWELKGRRQCMAIDRYRRVADNLAAIAASLEAMRAIERHGGAEILERAFTGFAALPERTSSSAWRGALGFLDNQMVTLSEAESAYRAKVKQVHGDVTGENDDAMRQLLEHRRQFQFELGAK